MPKATSLTEEYEPKGMPRCEVNEVSELWFSGNQESPIMTTSKSRRDLIFKTHDTWKGDDEKFGQLYKHLGNPDVGKAWFEALRHRDIKGFNPRYDNPRTGVRAETNQASMPPVHQFLTEFFVEKQWLNSLRPYCLRTYENVLVYNHPVACRCSCPAAA